MLYQVPEGMSLSSSLICQSDNFCPCLFCLFSSVLFDPELARFLSLIIRAKPFQQDKNDERKTRRKNTKDMDTTGDSGR